MIEPLIFLPAIALRAQLQGLQVLGLEEATRLLSDPNLHLLKIISRLGYSEQTSFTRAFRRWTNTTPGEWRDSRRKIEKSAEKLS